MKSLLIRITLIALSVVFLPVTSFCQALDKDAVTAEILRVAEENIEQYRKGEVSITFRNSDGSPVRNASIEIRQTRQDFLFGAVVFHFVRNLEPDYEEKARRMFLDCFNFGIFPFYWGKYEPAPGMTKWEQTLRFAEYCNENGITTKGHTLVWSNRQGTPEWLSSFPADMADELLKAHVMKSVGGFAGKIDMWDVVNEPIHLPVWQERMTKNNAPSTTAIADYVEKAYKWAHAANPKANLILNEYDLIPNIDTHMESDTPPRERFTSLIKELERRDTPLSGIGMQAHEPQNDWYDPRKIIEGLDEIAALGYPIHITELIPQSSGKEIGGGWQDGIWTEKAQADYAELLYTLFFSHPAVKSINWWGITDRHIWLKGGGFLDWEYNPKPVYNRLKGLIRGKWLTSLEKETGPDGSILFRGFYGDYNVVMTTRDGTKTAYSVHVGENEENSWVFTADK